MDASLHKWSKDKKCRDNNEKVINKNWKKLKIMGLKGLLSAWLQKKSQTWSKAKSRS